MWYLIYNREKKLIGLSKNEPDIPKGYKIVASKELPFEEKEKESKKEPKKESDQTIKPSYKARLGFHLMDV